jgi:formylglycine-generating enzyme required for sulfatase activity
MIVVRGGVFLMGSPAGVGFDDERPRHQVDVAPFLLGRYPVTQDQWAALMGPKTCRFKGGLRPVENVSWHDAEQFCLRLARHAGHPYRLPSEAEWEHACRAGSATPFAFGETLTTSLVNYCGEHTHGRGPLGLYRHTTTDVGQFLPNGFGLSDMHGTLWEWCADVWHVDYRGARADGRAWQGGDGAFGVARVGSWHDPPDLCRSSARLRVRRREGDEFTGFRVAADPF